MVQKFKRLRPGFKYQYSIYQAQYSRNLLFKTGKQRLAGIDFNKNRTIAIMESVLALAIKPNGYTVSDIAILMKERLDKKQAKGYTPAKVAYDIRKLN